MKRPAADFLGYMTENLGRNGTNGSSVSVGLPDGQVNLKKYSCRTTDDTDNGKIITLMDIWNN